MQCLPPTGCDIKGGGGCNDTFDLQGKFENTGVFTVLCTDKMISTFTLHFAQSLPPAV